MLGRKTVSTGITLFLGGANHNIMVLAIASSEVSFPSSDVFRFLARDWGRDRFHWGDQPAGIHVWGQIEGSFPSLFHVAGVVVHHIHLVGFVIIDNLLVKDTLMVGSFWV